MERRKREYPMGSVSTATMREEDLIPAFVDELRWLVRTTPGKHPGYLRECRAIESRMQKPGYYESEDAAWDLNEYLFEALNDFAAPYFYFGAHPGDGSDYGFWLDEYFEDDFDGLKVSDLSEVPANYAREILLVNDHGNITLYTKARTRPPREVWAVV